MRPVETPDANVLFTSDVEGIDPLPVERVGDRVLLSTWELTDEDREQLREGGQIELAIHSMTLPPVSLIVTPPYCKECRQRMAWSSELQTWCCAHDPGGPT